jgi:putative ABC transport system permease protein
MSAIGHDLRYAARTFRKRPGFTAIAIFTLTLGIGVNVAVFAMVSSVVLRPLDYPKPERLVKISGLGRAAGGRALNLSRADFRDFARASRAFESMGAFDAGIGAVTVTGFGEAERVKGVTVSGGFFQTLQATPQLGRLIEPRDDATNVNVGVISYALWQRHFGGDPAVVGRTMSVGRQSFAIVGVLRQDFRYPQPEMQGDPDLYGPMGTDPASAVRSTRNIRAIGRLKPNVTAEQAQADLSSIAAELERRYPADDQHAGVVVERLMDTIVGDTRQVLWLLLGATLSVFLVGCANLANLLLAKGLGRTREMAIRSALGASRGRLAWQLVTESLLLSLCGGLCAVVAGEWIVQAAVAVGRHSLPRVNEIQVDARTLIFCVLLAIAACLLFGVVPALRLSKTALEESLRQGGRAGVSMNRSASSTLVMVEVALSTTLLAAAGLFVQSFWRLAHVDPGFQTEGLLTAQVSLPAGRYPQEQRVQFFDELYQRVGGLPGVRAVAATNILPLSGSHSCDAIRVDAHPASAGRQPCAETRSVSENYFRTMGIRLIRGREFDRRDQPGSQKVVLINQAMAEWLWPGEEPLGQTITIVSLGPAEAPREVVGIVGNTVHSHLAEAPVPQYYLPQHQPPGYQAMTLVIRAHRPVALTAAVRNELAQMDPNIPLFNARTFSELRDASVESPWFRTLLFGAFALVALALAVGGVYGVISYTVNQRMHELGLRMCLGARPSDIAWLLGRQSLVPVVLGIVLGLAGAMATQRWIAALLYSVRSYDWWTLLAIAAVLTMVSLAAIRGPIRRASACDPAVAMRGA